MPCIENNAATEVTAGTAPDSLAVRLRRASRSVLRLRDRVVTGSTGQVSYAEAGHDVHIIGEPVDDELPAVASVPTGLDGTAVGNAITRVVDSDGSTVGLWAPTQLLPKLTIINNSSGDLNVGPQAADAFVQLGLEVTFSARASDYRRIVQVDGWLIGVHMGPLAASESPPAAFFEMTISYDTFDTANQPVVTSYFEACNIGYGGTATFRPFILEPGYLADMNVRVRVHYIGATTSSHLIDGGTMVVRLVETDLAAATAV